MPRPGKEQSIGAPDSNSYDFFRANVQKEEEARQKLADLNRQSQEIERDREALKDLLQKLNDERRDFYTPKPKRQRQLPRVSLPAAESFQLKHDNSAPEQNTQVGSHVTAAEDQIKIIDGGTAAEYEDKLVDDRAARLLARRSLPPSASSGWAAINKLRTALEPTNMPPDIVTKTYRHIVRADDGTYVALSCHICGANARRNGEWLSGRKGIRCHYSQLHNVGWTWDTNKAYEHAVKDIVNDEDLNRIRLGEAPRLLRDKKLPPVTSNSDPNVTETEKVVVPPSNADSKVSETEKGFVLPSSAVPNVTETEKVVVPPFDAGPNGNETEKVITLNINGENVRRCTEGSQELQELQELQKLQDLQDLQDLQG